MYSVILVSYMVAECDFWAAGSFPYVFGMNLLNSVIPIFFISFIVGILLGLMFDFRSLFIK